MGRGKTKGEEQLTKDLEKLIARLNKVMLGDTEENLSKIGLKIANIGIEIKAREKGVKGPREKYRKETKIRSGRVEKAIQMLSEGINPEVIAKEMGYLKVRTVYAIMKMYHIAPRKKVISFILEEKDDVMIAKQTNWKVEAIEKLRKEQEINRKEKEKKQAKITKRKERVKQLIEMASNGISPSMIAKELKYSKTETVYTIMKNHHIASRKKVAGFILEEDDDDVIAKQTNWTVVAIAKVRQEENEKKNKIPRKKASKLTKKQGRKNAAEVKNKKVETNPSVVERKIETVEPKETMEKPNKGTGEGITNSKSSLINDFLALAREVTSRNTMAEQLNITTEKVNELMKTYRVIDRTVVVKLLSKYTNAEIAVKGNVSEKAVATIREQEKRKEEKRSSPQTQAKIIEKQKKQAEEQALKIKEFLSTARRYESIEKWEAKTGVSSCTIVTYLKKARNQGTISKKQLELLEDWEKRYVISQSLANRKVDFQKYRINYIFEIERINGNVTPFIIKTINYKNEVLLAKYEDFLTSVEYAFMCYAYMKVGEYYAGIQFAKEHLGLQETSIVSVKNKIDEILSKEKQVSKKPEVPAGAAGGER